MENNNMETAWVLDPGRMREVMEAYEAARRLFASENFVKVTLHTGQPEPDMCYISIVGNLVFLLGENDDLRTLVLRSDNVGFHPRADRKVEMDFLFYDTAIEMED